MHVAGISTDLNSFLQFLVSLALVVIGLIHLLKNTASRYLEADTNFERGDKSVVPVHSTNMMPTAINIDNSCAVCGNWGRMQCSCCKAVRYCSQNCQQRHWKSGHKTTCRALRLCGKVHSNNSVESDRDKTLLRATGGITLIPDSGRPIVRKKPKKVLFPYNEYLELYKSKKLDLLPCGLFNCGNSCFANVVLQCLTFTRPLSAYLLEGYHSKICRRNDSCFFCELQTHVERTRQSPHPFAPLNILSRLPNIGGNFGPGKQEDAHEFMRFAIDTMQSLCLEEFGGEKVVHPLSLETTLIQHIFGGHLESQVICMKCNKVSNQYENMMDLNVEIHGDAASLEECLDQFTGREWLHGDNMYRCDGCNDYVKASKRLMVRRAPNVLTVALKRFQTGRFGKLNKRVTFPESLNLTPYVREYGDGNDIYRLYAVVIHVDMLNSSYFGHYICYVKEFSDNWYKIDDDKVKRVDLEEVLSQSAYMLFYSRIQARPFCLTTVIPAPLRGGPNPTELPPSPSTNHKSSSSTDYKSLLKNGQLPVVVSNGSNITNGNTTSQEPCTDPDTASYTIPTINSPSYSDSPPEPEPMIPSASNGIAGAPIPMIPDPSSLAKPTPNPARITAAVNGLPWSENI